MAWVEGMGRGPGQRAWAEGMGREHGQRALAENMSAVISACYHMGAHKVYSDTI